jgi:PKD domain-containing protein
MDQRKRPEAASRESGSINHRRIAAWGTALAAVLLVFVGVVISSGTPHRPPPPAPPLEEAEGSQASRGPRPGIEMPPAEPGDTQEPARDVGVTIDGVDVDKRDICRGQEVVVNVRARATDGAGAYLNFGVLGQPELVGSTFSLHPRESIGYGWMRVFARGKRGLATIAAVPPITVRDCEVPVQVTVDVRRPPDMPDRAVLTAQIVTSGAGQAEPSSFEAAKYTWDFGDGTSATSTSPEVEHSYEGRRQDRAYSYFWVAVEAHDHEGRTVRGSRSLRFVNLGFRPFVRDDRVLVFAGARPDGAGGEKLWLYHGHGSPVRLDRVVVSTVVRDATGRETTTASRGYEPAAVLGFIDLPAGDSRVTSGLDSLRPSEAGASATIEVSGRSADGKAASAAFRLPALPALAQTEKEQEQ